LAERKNCRRRERSVASLLSVHQVVEKKYSVFFVCNSIRPFECFLITLAKMSDDRKVSTIEEVTGTFA